MLVAGCEMFPPDDSQIAPVAGSAPTIDIPEGSVGDSTFTVTITPAAGTGFYAYLITDTKSAIDGSSLLSQSYEGLYTGLENAAEIESVTINANAAGGIMPGTLYYIYAVGASQEQGIASAAVYDSVYTTNSNVPIFDDEVAFAASADGSYVDIALNDVVKAGEGKVYYDVFSTYPDSEGNYYSIFDAKQVVPADSIVYSGKIVRVKTPANVPNGAVVNITWDEGAFVNSADKMAKAYTVCNYTGLDTKLGDGILYRKAPVSWTISYPDILVNDTTLHSTAEDTIGLVNLASEGFVFVMDSTISILFNSPEITYYNQDNSVFSYPATQIGILSDSTFVVYVDPNQMPERGTWMSINIPAGTLSDEFGNTNAAFTSNQNFIYSFGWEMEDLYGNYEAIGISLYDGQINLNEEGSPLVIRPVGKDDKDASDNNVVIENLIQKGTKLYAKFGKDDGLLHIPAGQSLWDGEDKISVYNNETGYGPIYGQDSVITGYKEFIPTYVFYDYSGYGYDVTLSLVQPGYIMNVDPSWSNYSSYWMSLIFDGNEPTGFLNDAIIDHLFVREGETATASLKPSAIVPEPKAKLYKK